MQDEGNAVTLTRDEAFYVTQTETVEELERELKRLYDLEVLCYWRWFEADATCHAGYFIIWGSIKSVGMEM